MRLIMISAHKDTIEGVYLDRELIRDLLEKFIAKTSSQQRYPGPLKPFAELFPELSVHSIQFNAIFQIFVQLRCPGFYYFRKKLPQRSMDGFFRKAFAQEVLSFTKYVCYHFMPHLTEIFRKVNESHTVVFPNAIPPEVAYSLLEMIDFADEICSAFPEVENTPGVYLGLRVMFYRCLIYRSLGDEISAVDAVRKLLVSIKSYPGEFIDPPTQRTVIWAFVAVSCLLHYGHIKEAEENFPVIEEYAKHFSEAKDAIRILRALKSSLLLGYHSPKEPDLSGPVIPPLTAAFAFIPRYTQPFLAVERSPWRPLTTEQLGEVTIPPHFYGDAFEEPEEPEETAVGDYWVPDPTIGKSPGDPFGR